jgi:HPt (histidine-containing phosphotransfer) domain-containing protein
MVVAKGFRKPVNKRIVVQVDAELEVLIPRFLANRRRDLEAIERNLAARDFGRMEQTGHDLKGVGGGYGFDRISELGAAIEDAALRRDAHALAALAAEYRTFLANVEVVYVQ